MVSKVVYGKHKMGKVGIEYAESLYLLIVFLYWLLY